MTAAALIPVIRNGKAMATDSFFVSFAHGAVDVITRRVSGPVFYTRQVRAQNAADQNLANIRLSHRNPHKPIAPGENRSICVPRPNVRSNPDVKLHWNAGRRI